MKCTQRKEPERNKNRELATRQPQEAFSPAVEPEKYQEQECWFHQNLIIQVLRKFQFKVIKGYYNLFHDLIRLIFIGMLCIDRKSTRLNSSHVAISYADFFLKKKD